MTTDISERQFEETIESVLLREVSDSSTGHVDSAWANLEAHGKILSGGYHKRLSEDYDQELCLLPRDVLDFVSATQPREWEKLTQHYGSTANEQFLSRLSSEIKLRGTLDVLRKGVKDVGCHFHLAYFRPASGLNEETRKLHASNLFAVVRQVRYSTKNSNSLDMVLFLNGFPIFTVELKNPLNGQNVHDAISQYRQTRDPREPLFASGRCLAHFAVDPEWVYVTTHLNGPKTRFLPFNKGKFGGAGNPPIPPTQNGHATAYLWEKVWARDSVLDLVRQFVHESEQEEKIGTRRVRPLIFPRYHQIDCVRRLLADAYDHGVGQRYLIQHSAGSGKSLTIAWLAHRLATLHNRDDRRVFDSIVVITDRRVLDRQLQGTIRQFEQTLGMVENIDKTSKQLKEALESGKTIIVTTLQKFPVIVEQIGKIPGKRFALIVDEAHSSQSGESTKSLKAVLAADTLEAAEDEESGAATPEEELENTILDKMRQRGRLPNTSTFAFTATPKAKTLELFGSRQQDGTFKPFHLYSMRQAVEEGFICDVLANYSTYKAYWSLIKKIEDDPRYEKNRARSLLISYAELHPHAIRKKVEIMIGHFAEKVQSEIDGQAKAMIVTRSRKHAVRYKLEVDRFIQQKNYPFKALVAFSGTVKDEGVEYTEARMNSVSEEQTVKAFEKSDYRILIVANKFQTGFDQPLLHTMYVDKILGGVNAVQTLSRLNRVHPDKDGTAVLDFANTADDIKKAFEPYYETTLLSESTDPNLLYNIQTKLAKYPVYTQSDVDAFAKIYFTGQDQTQLSNLLQPIVARAQEMEDPDPAEFRSLLKNYSRLYSFLAQVMPFKDPDLEKFHYFARYLWRLLPPEPSDLPFDIRQNIGMGDYRAEKIGHSSIKLEDRVGALEPMQAEEGHAPPADQPEPLSEIIMELNRQFGLDLGPEHRGELDQVMQRLYEDAALSAAAKVNARDNVQLAFEQRLEQQIQDIVEVNYELYQRITSDKAFGDALKTSLFDHYLRTYESKGC